MKFRGRMMDTGSMRDFTTIVTTISRMTRSCVLRLATDELCFIVGDERVPVLWAVLSQEYFFTEYTMSGVTDNENEIYVEFETSMLARSLNSLKTAKSVRMKLCHKRQPCLTFEIDLTSLTTETRQCMHDVPVRLLSRKEWSESKMPVISEFDISLEVPQIRYMRHIVEKMKTMSPRVTLIATKQGTLLLRVEVDHATVTTHFKDLQVCASKQEEQEEDEDSDITATVNVKKLAMFLGWDILRPDSVKCNILKERMVKLIMDVGDHVKMHYFMPAIAS